MSGSYLVLLSIAAHKNSACANCTFPKKTKSIATEV